MKKVLIATFLSSVLLSACAGNTKDKIAITSLGNDANEQKVNFYEMYDDVYGDGTEEIPYPQTSTTTTTETTNETSSSTSVTENGQTQQVEQSSFSQETTTVETVTPAPEPEVAPQLEPQPQPVEQSNADIDVSKTAFGAMGNYKIGNPYLIDGVSYYPHEDYSYSEIGIASWYGPDFHGGTTSNGEVFDETKLTAAHRTLPMPSLVRVTNLENGVSANIKINDRGPYARDRILDLSSAAADVLGIKQKGTARVKVEILPEESRRLKELAIASQNTDIYPPEVSYSMAQEAQPVYEPQPSYEPIPEVDSTPVRNSASASDGDYYVQVAAFTNYEKADALKDKLTKFGTVKIFKAVIDGNTYFKVRLGEFETQSEAERVQRAVSNAGISGSRVIRKEDGGFKWKL